MAKPTKRCYYEVLGVPRDATADEIRYSFRLLALQLHPDKQAASGVLSIADATVAFQQLLEAYNVLSDPNQRDRYDSHRRRSVVPRSETSFSSSSDLFFDLSRFFTCDCFYGFSDSGKGFFKVYGEVFSKIHSQELYFAGNLGLGIDPAPPIGNVHCSYAQFVAFYNYWLGFSTVIDFDWFDEEDRYEAVCSWNRMVRDLATFVQRLDRRLVDVRRRKEREENEKAREKARAKNMEYAARRRNLVFGDTEELAERFMKQLHRKWYDKKDYIKSDR